MQKTKNRITNVIIIKNWNKLYFGMKQHCGTKNLIDQRGITLGKILYSCKSILCYCVCTTSWSRDITSFRKLNFQLIKCSAFHLLASKDLNCVAFQCFNYGRTWKGFKKMRHLCILSLKISNGQSESVNRRTDNTMAKRKRTNNNLQNIHINL